MPPDKSLSEERVRVSWPSADQLTLVCVCVCVCVCGLPGCGRDCTPLQQCVFVCMHLYMCFRYCSWYYVQHVCACKRLPFSGQY